MTGCSTSLIEPSISDASFRNESRQGLKQQSARLRLHYCLRSLPDRLDASRPNAFRRESRTQREQSLRDTGDSLTSGFNLMNLLHFLPAPRNCIVELWCQGCRNTPLYGDHSMKKLTVTALAIALASSLAVSAQANDCGCPPQPCCKTLSLPKLELPKLCMPKLELPKLCMPKLNLPKLELPKLGYKCCPKPDCCSAKPSCAAPAKPSCACPAKPACPPSCAAPCAPACAPKAPSCAAPALSPSAAG